MRSEAVVIVSYYNARDEGQLDMLLWQLGNIPAGYPFDTVVVVNQATNRSVDIQTKYPGVFFIYRENVGFNIGAWDHGWRSFRSYRFYVFLQDECLIAREGWLRRYIAAAGVGEGALIGESLSDPALTWDETQQSFEQWRMGGRNSFTILDERSTTLVSPFDIRNFIVAYGVEPLVTMRHLQSVVLCASSELMTKIDGFPMGTTYVEAVGAEVLISQLAESMGFAVKQAAVLPFTFVMHPQWMQVRSHSRTVSGMVRCFRDRMFPGPARMKIRHLLRRS